MWMCKLCYPDAEEIGVICPGYSLILQEGKYHILGGQGHSDHIIYTFSVKPYSDPDPECLFDNDDDKWLEEILRPMEDSLRLPPDKGYRFVLNFYKEHGEPEAGDGGFQWVLCNFCGQLVEKYHIEKHE